MYFQFGHILSKNELNHLYLEVFFYAVTLRDSDLVCFFDDRTKLKYLPNFTTLNPQIFQKSMSFQKFLNNFPCGL